MTRGGESSYCIYANLIIQRRLCDTESGAEMSTGEYSNAGGGNYMGFIDKLGGVRTSEGAWRCLISFSLNGCKDSEGVEFGSCFCCIYVYYRMPLSINTSHKYLESL